MTDTLVEQVAECFWEAPGNTIVTGMTYQQAKEHYPSTTEHLEGKAAKAITLIRPAIEQEGMRKVVEWMLIEGWKSPEECVNCGRLGAPVYIEQARTAAYKEVGEWLVSWIARGFLVKSFEGDELVDYANSLKARERPEVK